MNNLLKSALKPVLISFASYFGPHARKGNSGDLWILMYHRILPAHDARFQLEEPGMLVKPETFEMHVKEIKRNFDLISLGEWVSAKERGEKLPPKACAITFDDGWLDNFEYALPILKNEAAPATLFVVADKIGTDFQFWPNIVSILLLNGAAKAMCLHPLFEPLSAKLTAVTSSSSRDELANIILHLKKFSDEAIFSALEDISWRSLCPANLPPALMDWDQLKAMQNTGLVEIGSHTCTHRRLTNFLQPNELEHEIVTSKLKLQEKLNTPVNLFCFPNGDYNQEALSLVMQNYSAAVTTRRGINLPSNTNLHELTRIGLHEEVSQNKEKFRARLSGWL
ncbi:polysaccharide deacetylase [Cellvibrio zantedeschiae]|uniref:Polysaccharide deacetylase n=1 Tax=Cellvibrio zantedeschiae TaxID=1237077 RepID=A0ABQ3BB59_9GAMM|nr:polysaccharide deacetylase family protein [Cellvibrio zantedeschiae]GGY82308.1 polysaccharide deacetylase [Cellvibrio zantedeschiae]